VPGSFRCLGVTKFVGLGFVLHLSRAT
jgi:hypothetical protein